mmetsp:Transcript_5612/g.8998  ORF Transcript_5612/g.8998 Transcript_5612/m.8998 type:complete len:99 (+) Transcript_5612:130-426(+)|eukprot:CAMPEP_0179415482 /NCGR_PEP_ID=MMETSP0799-20121207/6255_1 /TAXON_ID=46947 /ORGANISM="Geminigera cryophila, Strain CCMP2564" /LENGTH=98 /DNA_ID=CAMNT_0021188223 /DNA_START=42 /DNA_END=338 /DNA_ORIENTATION=+
MAEVLLVAGLAYAYTGIVHSYLTSELNEGPSARSIPKGRIDLDENYRPVRFEKTDDYCLLDGTSHGHTVTAGPSSPSTTSASSRAASPGVSDSTLERA